MHDLGFNAPDEDPDEVGRCKVTAGFHRATTIKAEIDDKGQLHLIWRFESAPWEGHILDDGWHQVPSLCMTTDEIPKAARHMWVLLCRLGIAKKEQKGQGIKPKLEQFVGITRVLEIKQERNKKKPEDPTLWTNIVYGAYYDETRAEIGAADRIRLGMPLLPGQETPLFDANESKAAKPKKESSTNASASAPAAATFDPAEV